MSKISDILDLIMMLVSVMAISGTGMLCVNKDESFLPLFITFTVSALVLLMSSVFLLVTIRRENKTMKLEAEIAANIKKARAKEIEELYARNLSLASSRHVTTKPQEPGYMNFGGAPPNIYGYGVTYNWTEYRLIRPTGSPMLSPLKEKSTKRKLLDKF